MSRLDAAKRAVDESRDVQRTKGRTQAAHATEVWYARIALRVLIEWATETDRRLERLESMVSFDGPTPRLHYGTAVPEETPRMEVASSGDFRRIERRQLIVAAVIEWCNTVDAIVPARLEDMAAAIDAYLTSHTD